MTGAFDLASFNDRRRKAAANVLEKPALYKVCECCDMVVSIKLIQCPACHHLQFLADESEVRRVANTVQAEPSRNFPIIPRWLPPGVTAYKAGGSV